MKPNHVPLTWAGLILALIFAFTSAADEHDLEAIGERLKAAVDAGELTEKEAWKKWRAVQKEQGEWEEDEDDDDDDDDE